jgi:hypothetical protein
MWKPILAATTALTIAGAGLAVAQQTPAPQPPAQQAQPDAQRARPTPEDLAALTDARIAALRAGLKLTAEQEKNWPAVEAAIRDLAKERADRLAERRQAREARRADDRQRRPDAIERLRRGADAMTTRAAAIKRLADAAEPLYNSLDDGQKRRFALLIRMGGRERAMHWHRRG